MIQGSNFEVLLMLNLCNFLGSFSCSPYHTVTWDQCDRSKVCISSFRYNLLCSLSSKFLQVVKSRYYLLLVVLYSYSVIKIQPDTSALLVHKSPVHGLIACGGEDGFLECFDLRQKASVGRIRAVGTGNEDQVKNYSTPCCAFHEAEQDSSALTSTMAL